MRVTEPESLTEGEKEFEGVAVACGLLLDAPLSDSIADPVGLTVLHLLEDAHELADAPFEVDGFLLPLKEELPLTERDTSLEALIDGEKEFVGVAVVCRLPLDEPLSVVHVDPVTLTVLLLLEDAHEDADARLVDDALPLPLIEGLPLTVRTTEPDAVREVEKEFEEVVVMCGLPLNAPLPVGSVDHVALTVLLLLEDAHEDADAPLVVDALLQPLNEELPLSDLVVVPTSDADADADMVSLMVNCGLLLKALLMVDKKDPVALTVVLWLSELRTLPVGKGESVLDSLSKAVVEDVGEPLLEAVRDEEAQLPVADAKGLRDEVVLWLITPEMEIQPLSVPKEELVGDVW